MNRHRGQLLHIIWTASIMICLLAVVFSLAYAAFSPSGGQRDTVSDPPPGGSQLPGVTSPAEDSAPPDVPPPPDTPAPPTILAETADMGQEYLDKFYFMGDSTTNGLAAYHVVDDNRVWTPKSGTFSLFLQSTITIYDRVSQRELTIEELFALYKPEYLLITLGVNGVQIMPEDNFIKQYTNLVERIQKASPDTKIIINSMYPTTKAYSSARDGISNDKINWGNGLLIGVAEQTGARYLDSETVLKNEEGFLRTDYCNDGKLHLFPVGYEKVLGYLRTHGYI